MRFTQVLVWLPPLLVLGGCHPPNPPNPAHTAQLSAVSVTCTPASVPAYRTGQCTASATDQDGQPFTVSGFTWTSSNEAVARVDASGKVSASSRAGSVTVSASATADGVTQQGQASVTITDAVPTVHATALSASETWRASDNPHLVRGSLEVNASSLPTLTLEAGVVVLFEPDAELRFTQGSLKAVGTQAEPIQLMASAATAPKGSWRGLVFTTPGSASQLEYVSLSHCGASTGAGACVDVEKTAAPVLRFVSVDNSGTVGVRVADDGSALGSGSTQLSVKDGAGYAVSLGANQADSLPQGGSFTGNTPNAVLLQGNVSRTLTWANPGIPYVVKGPVYIQSSAGNTLSIAAGTVVRFDGKDSALLIGIGAGTGTETGELSVNGTASAPVLLTSNADSPAPGQWSGVLMSSGSSATSRLSHVTIEYAGADMYGQYGAYGNLSIIGDATGVCRPGPVLDNVTIQKSGSIGLYTDQTGIGPGSNSVSLRDNASDPLIVDPQCASTLPTDVTISGSPINAVTLGRSTVYTTQTWPKLSVPYLIEGRLLVGGAYYPTLTLQPGTELMFNAKGTLSIGRTGESANLVAQGTAASPIRFSSMTPGSKGAWLGLYFVSADTNSKLDHVVISGAGKSNGTTAKAFGDVNVLREMGAFITNSTFSDSSDCGITRSDGSASGTTAVTTDFTLAAYGNTFTNNTGGMQCTN